MPNHVLLEKAYWNVEKDVGYEDGKCQVLLLTLVSEQTIYSPCHIIHISSVEQHLVERDHC